MNTTDTSAMIGGPTPLRRATLGLVVMFLGGSGLVYEYCLSTLATHLVGNSVEQFSLIIALMLFAMGIAGWVQRGLRDDGQLAFYFVTVEIMLAVVGGASALILYLAFGWLDHFRFVLYGLALLIGFGIGLEIPLLLRINAYWRKALSENVSDILALDYVGALVGALVWAYLLLPMLPLDQISLILGLANLGAAVVTLITLRTMLRGRVLLLCGGIFAAAALLLSMLMLGPKLVDDARQNLYADPIQHSAKSVYQDIVVTGYGPRMSLYLNGRLQFDTEDEFIYHEMLVHPAAAMVPEGPESVLVMGGGDGLAVREVLKWPTVKTVLVVDLDPAVTQLARTYPPLVQLNDGVMRDARVETRAFPIQPGPKKQITKVSEHPRQSLQGEAEVIASVRVMNLDADAFLRDMNGNWDLIVADFPDPSTPDLAKLYSLEMFIQVAQHLSPNGVFVTQSGSPYTNRSAFWSIASTMEAAGFSTKALHTHVPTFGEWGWQIGVLEGPPKIRNPFPAPTRFITPVQLEYAGFFPANMARRPSDQNVSTRLDPWVMRLYNVGEPLAGPVYFPGRGETR